jgi:hypothetical protein
MRAQNDARNKLALAFRDHKRPSTPPSLAAVLFGTATNTRFVELAFDVSRTTLHDALVYGPWRVAGPFRVERCVDRF